VREIIRGPNGIGLLRPAPYRSDEKSQRFARESPLRLALRPPFGLSRGTAESSGPLPPHSRQGVIRGHAAGGHRGFMRKAHAAASPREGQRLLSAKGRGVGLPHEWWTPS